VLLPDLVGHNIGRAGGHEFSGIRHPAGSSNVGIVSQKPDALLDPPLKGAGRIGVFGGQVQVDIAQVLLGFR